VGDGDDLASHYEALRQVAVSEGVDRAGLGAGLLVTRGMAAWVRGWRACTPWAARPAAPAPAPVAAPGDVVGVLAAMALACM
jgi:hypothetical protein